MEKGRKNLVIGVAGHLNKASARISKERNEASSKMTMELLLPPARSLKSKAAQSGARTKGILFDWASSFGG